MEITEHLIEVLRRDGMLLLSDAVFPSVAAEVAGAPVAGSWWGHPKGGEIYNASSELTAHADVLTLKLIDGKVTFLHRDLWGPFLALATSGEEWQRRGVTPEAGMLLDAVIAGGEVRLDRLELPELAQSGGTKVMAAAARDLERRLLLHSREIHTERGAHAKCLATWGWWISDVGYEPPEITTEEAREELDARLARLNKRCGGGARFPWHSYLRRIKSTSNSK